MRAEIKYIHSPDLENLHSGPTDGPFCILLQFMIGPEGGNGEESFDMTVCSPSWLEMSHEPIISGEHLLIMKTFSVDAVKEFMMRKLDAVEGNSWSEVAERLSRIAKWEFQDYSSS